MSNVQRTKKQLINEINSEIVSMEKAIRDLKRAAAEADQCDSLWDLSCLAGATATKLINSDTTATATLKMNTLVRDAMWQDMK